MKKRFSILFITIILFFLSGNLFAETSSSSSILGFTYLKLKNGMEVYMRPMRRAPLTAVRILFKGGFKDEPENHKGIAHLLEHMIFRGTEKYPAEAIYKLERRGGFFNGLTGFDFTRYEIMVPEKEVINGTEMLVDMVFNPAIPGNEFEIEKKIVLAENLEREASQTSFYSLNLLYDFILRHDQQGIISLTREDLVTFHAKIYKPENAVFIIAGKYDEKKILSILEKIENNDSKRAEEVTIKSKTGKTISEEVALQEQSYQLLMAYELGELSGNDLFLAKLIPYLIGYEGRKIDYLHGYTDITYELALDRIGNMYYLLIYYESADEKYTDELGDRHKEGMLKIVRRLTKKDFSRELKRINEILGNYKNMHEYSAVYATSYLISYLNSTYLLTSDLEAIKKVKNDDIHNFAKQKIFEKPYAWIVVRNKESKDKEQKEAKQ